ncbi:hypothetical protein ACEQ8H_008716 [Pleosporales sp. CAS-2024a]
MAMFKHPPDPNAPVLVGNRRSTVYGVTIPFQVLSLLAVLFRLYIRLRVVREPGSDDVLIAVAAILKLACLAAFFGGIQSGMGKQLIFNLENLQHTLVWFYITNAAYITTTVCVKLSLVCQYLRLFREGYRQPLVKSLLMLVSLWGGAFIFMGWFPCFPVSGTWNKYMSAPATCYGFGYRTVDEAKNMLFAFSGSNMAFDIAIFVIPLTEYFKPGLKRKQILAMTGLFALGSIVILMAILRLWSGAKYNNMPTMLNFTWWMPEVLTFSCLEVDFAIMCASMPIFWPSVMAAWTEILVTSEVTVVHNSRSELIEVSVVEMEWNHKKSHESTLGLGCNVWQEAPYFTTFDPETGRGPGSGLARVEIQLGTQSAR